MLKYPWLLLLLLHYVLSQTTDKYSDEDRPYKFGFNIQGYQHRQEEKDEKGLIKGEYGFITADGYYRVTVYATDENGDFRIISMKNYYVGFPPEDPSTTPIPSGIGQGKPLNLVFGNQKGPTISSKDDARSGKSFVRPQGLAACSDCSIPTTTPKSSVGVRPGIGQLPESRSGEGLSQGPRGFGGPQQGIPGSTFGGQGPQGSPKSRFGGQNAEDTPGAPKSGFGSQGTPGSGFGGSQNPQGGGGRFETPQATPGFGGGLSQLPETPGSRLEPTLGGFGGSRPSSPLGGSNRQGGSRDPKSRNDFPQNNQLGEGPRRRPQIGEVRDGLPPGVSVNDIKDLLYTFNYTVGFHGHHEDGYRNGDKEGDYFFDGRDGVERKVEYLANEFGFQPNITLIDLPDNDVRKPKEETEKEYGLKGYEFKWFYRR